MANRHGDFIWYEYLGEDPPGAAKFYDAVVGLKRRDSGMEGYHLLDAADGTEVAGMMQLDPAMQASGARPGWYGYVAVDDVDAAAATARARGGAVAVEPREIEGVGRFAGLTDPAGALFYVMQGKPGDESHSFSSGREPGRVGWNELLGGDLDSATDFYGAQFGWEKGETMETPQGPYQLFGRGEEMIGGMMQAQGDMPPAWNSYFWSDGIEAAIERTKAAGGSLFHGPQDIPGGDVIMFGHDPQGAMFCLVGPR